MDPLMFIVLVLSGLAAGAFVAWFLARSKYNKPLPFSMDEYLAAVNARDITEGKLAELRLSYEQMKSRSEQATDKITSLSAELSRVNTINESLLDKLETQKSEIAELQKLMKEQFENIAGKIVMDNSRLIQQQHSDKLKDLLSPLKEKIEKFEQTVSTTHKENIRDNQSLKEQLKLLQDLNKSIGEEARNLTTALKGQVKTQGNWGELILESILERSGLVKDREYVVQSSLTSEEGRRLQPDVLVRLPEGKTIVIDSKVSLVAYERYCSTDNPDEKEAALKEHIMSVRRHIKGLGEKKYQQLYGLKSLDFVLLFVPIEPAFNTAIQHDNNLFNDAFDNNIVIVSTSTLLATLRTIASIWKLEYQNKNSQEIARQGGALYDKFVGFLEDFQKIGNLLDSARKTFDSAHGKLSTGRGNLVVSVQKLKKLGVNSTKKIPAELYGYDNEDQDENSSSSVDNIDN
jgi:DNA recombination protein RmuC